MRLLAVGVVLSLLGLGGYVAGVVVAYPGRSFTIAVVMIGLTLVAIGRTPGEGSA
ncbi:hypothetical protein HLRTI_002777 [Halorhabdus tiamatea SARL4B]|uniref:Uncharacterized protein n=1 Tax=Halorhabdus tiamatea SARL4B TaxID=1033806 RepID=F7PI89_9EURY|nr:hypothetical protein [Halorhabdus tiamatea]ERJ05265.1 hypothetical protein HLRTI_002777 [Halorhabdus tiamatea SARL4B]CCQ32164.1 hypothetical protein HTIA_0012 [Halorhabdus tiamatea SARL4B]